MSRARSALANAGLTAASFCVGALVLEGAARAWVRASQARARRQAPALAPTRYDDVLGWAKTPGAGLTIRRPEFEISLRFNSKGCGGRSGTTPSRRERAAS